MSWPTYGGKRTNNINHVVDILYAVRVMTLVGFHTVRNLKAAQTERNDSQVGI